MLSDTTTARTGASTQPQHRLDDRDPSDHRHEYDRHAALPLRERDEVLRVAADVVDRVRLGARAALVLRASPGSGRGRVVREIRARTAGVACMVLQVVAADSVILISGMTLPRAVGNGDTWESDGLAAVAQLLDEPTSRPLIVCVEAAERLGARAAERLAELMRHDGVGWVITIDLTAATPAAAEWTMNHRWNATFADLHPLDPPAVGALVEAVVGATPSREVCDFAAMAEGQPATLVMLLRQAMEEQMIRVVDGVAQLVRSGTPEGMRQCARVALAELTPTARHAAMVAAVMGPCVSFDDVAGVLESGPAALLGPFEELAAAGIVRTEGDGLRFRDELVRRAIGDIIPHPARQALRRHAISIMAAAGRSPLVPALELAEAATSGDAAVGALVAAVRAITPTQPAAARTIVQQTLPLVAPNDPRRSQLVADLVTLTAVTGQFGETSRLAERVLARTDIRTDQVHTLAALTAIPELPARVRVAAGRRALLGGAGSDQQRLGVRATSASRSSSRGSLTKHSN